MKRLSKEASASIREFKINKFKIQNAMKKETWKFIIQTIVAILTAILTTLGVTSCMGV